MGLFDQVLGSVLGSLSQPQGGAAAAPAGGGNAAANAVLIAIATSAARTMISSATGQAQAAPAAGSGSLGTVIGTAIGGALSGALANAMHAPGAAPAAGATQAATPAAGAPAAPAAPAVPGALPAGGLGSVLTALGGSAALGALVDQFTQNGHGDMIRSWISQGPNPAIEPGQLAQALGPEAVSHLTQTTGMDTNALLTELARALPAALDHMTPEGRLPTDQEIHAAANAPAA